MTTFTMLNRYDEALTDLVDNVLAPLNEDIDNVLASFTGLDKDKKRRYYFVIGIIDDEGTYAFVDILREGNKFTHTVTRHELSAVAMRQFAVEISKLL